MRERHRVAVIFALFGFAISAAFFGYADLTDYVPHPALQKVAIILDPAALLGSYCTWLTDMNGHSLTGLLVFTFLSLVNSALYFGAGVLAGRLFWNPE